VTADAVKVANGEEEATGSNGKLARPAVEEKKQKRREKTTPK
jgi:hypothetical protein